jgi:hypothetical protein
MARLFIFLFLLSNTALAYNRADYKHWIDADKDCQNTRQEVLIEESISPLVLNKKGCKVLKGAWMDYYTKKIITNPTKLDIDHLVPLAEVDRSGGNKWSKKKKMQYANDLTNHEALIACDLLVLIVQKEIKTLLIGCHQIKIIGVFILEIGRLLKRNVGFKYG